MASGMAAVTMIAELIKPGENIVITKEVYGGTTRFFSEIAPKRGIEVYFCDFYDTEKLNNLINEGEVWELNNLLHSIKKEIAKYS